MREEKGESRKKPPEKEKKKKKKTNQKKSTPEARKNIDKDKHQQSQPEDDKKAKKTTPKTAVPAKDITSEDNSNNKTVLVEMMDIDEPLATPIKRKRGSSLSLDKLSPEYKKSKDEMMLETPNRNQPNLTNRNPSFIPTAYLFVLKKLKNQTKVDFNQEEVADKTVLAEMLKDEFRSKKEMPSTKNAQSERVKLSAFLEARDIYDSAPTEMIGKNQSGDYKTKKKLINMLSKTLSDDNAKKLFDNLKKKMQQHSLHQNPPLDKSLNINE